MRIRILVLLGAVFAFTAVGGACGGDDDRLSAEDYYKKLDTIVQDAEKKLDEEDNKTPESQEPDAFKDFLLKLFEQSLRVVEDATKKVEELNPPDDVQPKHEAFVTTWKAVTEAAKEFSDTIRDTDADQVQALLFTDPVGPFEAAHRAACTALRDDAKSKNITADFYCGE